MKKSLIVSALLIVLYGCGSNSSSPDGAADDNTDSAVLTNPTAIDTVKHPSGMDNSSVISTDTAAMNVQNSLRKKDSAQKKQ